MNGCARVGRALSGHTLAARLLVAPLALAPAACASTTYRVETLDHTARPLPEARCSALIVHTADGRMVALRTWQLDPNTGELTGDGLRFTAARGAALRGPQHVRLEDTRLLECASTEERVGSTSTLVAAGVLGAALLFAATASP